MQLLVNETQLTAYYILYHHISPPYWWYLRTDIVIWYLFDYIDIWVIHSSCYENTRQTYESTANHLFCDSFV